MGSTGTIIAAVIVALFGSGGLFALVAHFRPERDNLTVDAAQKTVKLMREAMEELGEELEKARLTVQDLQTRLDVAIEMTHRLERSLEQERAKVARLEERMAELTRRQDDVEQE